MQKKWIKRAGNTIVFICLILLIKSIYDQDIDFAKYIWNKEYLTTYAVIILIYVFTIVLSSSTYKEILSLFGRIEINDLELKDIYITSNLGKYLPGNVMHFVGRNLLATKYNLKQIDVASSTIIELLLILTISFMLALSCAWRYIIKFIGYITKEFNTILILGIILIIVFVVATIFAYNKFKPQIIDTMQRIDKTTIKNKLVKAVTINLIVQILSSYTYVLLIQLIYPDIMLSGIELMGIYLLAWITGFVIPGSPGGLGVKEGILVFLLLGVVPQDIVLVSVVIHRCINIMAELLSYIGIKAIRLKKA